jgi:D-3-phosphoglycerate dehydrogenase / 2-oxoglutarate reductase
LHIPIDRQARPLIGAEQFSMMKDGVYLVNCARGGLVDEEALLGALDSGKVAAAALDVYAQEPLTNERLYGHDRISLTPHIGASTVEAQQNIGQEIIEIIRNNFREVTKPDHVQAFQGNTRTAAASRQSVGAAS